MENYINNLKRLSSRTDEMRKRLNVLQVDLRSITNDLTILARDIADTSKDRSYLRLNGRICRFINSSLLKGMTLPDAIQNAADTFNVPAAQVETVYHYENNRVKIVERLAKIWAVRRLKKLRYKNREIAKICGFSEKYLYDLLKKQQ